MTHFLKKDELWGSREIGSRHAAVKVRLVDQNTLMVCPEEEGKLNIIIVPFDTPVVVLPERVRVVDEHNLEVNRDDHLTRLVTTETIDPYHLVLDVRDEVWPLSRPSKSSRRRPAP